MPMTPADLLAHSDSGQPWPDGEGHPAFDDLAAAYQTALSVRALRLARGERPCGYKIGFTNRQIWTRYQVWAPIWGTVYDSTLVACDSPGSDSGQIALDRLCQPRLEPEAVFGFKATPPAGAGLDALFDALDWVAPGFELVQSHRPGWRFTAAETVADGGLHARLLIGRRQAVKTIADDAAALQAALAGATVALHRDQVRVESGQGANVLGDPLAALLHFLTELRACPGAPDIQPGDVVTTGTWTDAWPVQAGDRWTAHFSAPLTPLTVRFR
jgi:2-oxo-3-hexenedioate decarboxylase